MSQEAAARVLAAAEAADRNFSDYPVLERRLRSVRL